MVSARCTPDSCDYYKFIASRDYSCDYAYTIVLFRLAFSVYLSNSFIDSVTLYSLTGESSVAKISEGLSFSDSVSKDS